MIQLLVLLGALVPLSRSDRAPSRTHRRTQPAAHPTARYNQVVEIILSIAALQKGLYQVVSTSLLGSILSNMLFVLGMSFVAGGIKWGLGWVGFGMGGLLSVLF